MPVVILKENGIIVIIRIAAKISGLSFVIFISAILLNIFIPIKIRTGVVANGATKLYKGNISSDVQKNNPMKIFVSPVFPPADIAESLSKADIVAVVPNKLAKIVLKPIKKLILLMDVSVLLISSN